MTRDACAEFLEDPERAPLHLEECARCADEARQIEERLAASAVEPMRPIAAESIVTELPLAPWEGAGHRPWAFVLLTLMFGVISTTGLFLALGLSPIAALLSIVRQNMLERIHLMTAGLSLAKALQQAPMQFHLFILISFVFVNIIFYRLLRRAPRGYDV